MADGGETVHRIEIAGEMDRTAAEALTLEIRRLARRLGLDITSLRIKAADDAD